MNNDFSIQEEDIDNEHQYDKNSQMIVEDKFDIYNPESLPEIS